MAKLSDDGQSMPFLMCSGLFGTYNRGSRFILTNFVSREISKYCMVSILSNLTNKAEMLL
jgi:hypothetical protein